MRTLSVLSLYLESVSRSVVPRLRVRVCEGTGTLKQTGRKESVNCDDGVGEALEVKRRHQN